ncbi:MAG TPA: hypothetical protein V6C72_10840, partial [Chroococcales cyanobacterium]
MNRLYKAVLAISLALWTGAAPARSALAADTHEQQWIVDSIGRDVTEIVLFAAKKRGSADVDFDKLSFETTESQIDNAGFKYQYRMENPSLAQDSAFAIDDYVFASRNYLPWIEQLLARYKLSGEVSKEANASGSEELISKLSNFTDADIAIENKRITTALTEHPLDASLHEQAALLVALYGWRESAACFTDVRPWMNRIAAHLALATALQGAGKRTAAGDLANAVLLTLCKRQSDALAVAESISSGHPSEALSSWMRALKVRNTGDYRLADIKRATTVEKLEYARGLADDISTDSMSDYLDKEKIDTQVVPDWDRIALRGLSSVEAGHRYAIPSLKTEMDSYMADCAIYKKSSIKSSEEAVQGLSLRPTRCLIDDDGWKLEPVSWPDLADFHSRHILDSIYQTFHFVHHMWGVPEQAETLVAHADKTFA